MIGAALTAGFLFLAAPQLLGPRIVREGILKDPHVLVDGSEALKERQYEPVLAASRAALETPFGSSWKGAAKPDVTIAYFYDYACGYCRRSNPDLERLIAECREDQIGGVLALPVAETVKRVAKDEAGAQRIAGTEDRAQLWLAQTPQMFRAGLLAEALGKAPVTVTDESSAVEAMGLRPRLVLGSRENLKVTYAEDLAIAESILARRA